MNKIINRNIFILFILIVTIGVISIYSSTYNYGSATEIQRSFFVKQIFWAFISIIALLATQRINYRRFYDLALIIYAISIIALIVVLVLGRVVLGAKRWLELGGLNFQPSELAKLGVILILARYLSRRKAYGFRYILHGHFGIILRDLIIPLVIIVTPALLIFRQPDLGTALIFIPILLAMLFIAEVDLKYIVAFIVLMCFGAPIIWDILRDYQKDRLLVFLNPNIDPLGAGYTIIQSKIAVGSGRFLGRGWLSGTQNQLNFLPERHTDFIFSVIGEEWGFLGATILVCLYILLIYNIFLIIEQSKDLFAKYLGTGIVALLIFQVAINISMTVGICPVVGISLPLISYGGSSLCIFSVFIGILFNINKKRIVF